MDTRSTIPLPIAVLILGAGFCLILLLFSFAMRTNRTPPGPDSEINENSESGTSIRIGQTYKTNTDCGCFIAYERNTLAALSNIYERRQFATYRSECDRMLDSGRIRAVPVSIKVTVVEKADSGQVKVRTPRLGEVWVYEEFLLAKSEGVELPKSDTFKRAEEWRFQEAKRMASDLERKGYTRAPDGSVITRNMLPESLK